MLHVKLANSSFGLVAENAVIFKKFLLCEVNGTGRRKLFRLLKKKEDVSHRDKFDTVNSCRDDKRENTIRKRIH